MQSAALQRTNKREQKVDEEKKEKEEKDEKEEKEEEEVVEHPTNSGWQFCRWIYCPNREVLLFAEEIPEANAAPNAHTIMIAFDVFAWNFYARREESRMRIR
uniref:Uncharacterized protein n=1 Tax=Vespula pensylvanica TaxID=30213 RepID=A0A834P9M6_VESPE|nr:hypothetical protein H0235_002231 [Vespula pensylvanica]